MIDDGHGGSDHLKKGKEYSHEEISYLCRCGHSQNKPFCDGTHTKI
ncbi:MAG: CDGSH iron-sulfur domain-containing protein [Candidatus Peribacteria bacterium]|nr:CDGSH iron-sulfur domain-containing protein [Candidatus Peribacteria bacterium]